MGKLKQQVMATTEDDMGQAEVDSSYIKEIKIFNDFMDGLDLPTVPEPEGYTGECND